MPQTEAASPTAETPTAAKKPPATAKPQPRRRPPAGTKRLGKAPDLDDPKLFINRELSWLEFNRRVLEEALDSTNPLIERVKFLSIFSSNLDEFFMIRVAGLRRQHEAGVLTAPPDGMTPAEQLAALHDRLAPMLEATARCWREDLTPKLRQEGIKILAYNDLKRKQRKLLRRHFEREIFPALTPLAFDPGASLPAHLQPLSINLAVVIDRSGSWARSSHGEDEGAARVFRRLRSGPQRGDRGRSTGAAGPGRGGSRAPATSSVDRGGGGRRTWIRSVPGAWRWSLPFPFRVTRDADVEIEEDEASPICSIGDGRVMVGQRHFGSAIRLEVDARMPESGAGDSGAATWSVAPFQVFAVERAHGSLADRHRS